MKSQADWDKRSWCVGIGSGAVCVLLYALGTSLAPAYLPHGVNSGTQMQMWRQGREAKSLATLAANFLLPAVMCAIARRRFLLWSLLPPAMLGFSAMTYHLLQHDLPAIRRDLIIIPAYIIVAFLFVTGPIALVRSLAARSRRRQAAAEEDYKRQREAATIPQEGVWPPPPTQ